MENPYVQFKLFRISHVLDWHKPKIDLKVRCELNALWSNLRIRWSLGSPAQEGSGDGCFAGHDRGVN